MISLLTQNPLYFVLYAIGLVLAIAVHEFSHAYTADRLGDPTPRLQGRVTLNPIKHLDLLGTMFLFLIGFGWGKPVTFDPYNLKNPRRDSAIISIAGPISNFFLALLCSFLLYLFSFFNNSIFITIGSLLLMPLLQVNILLGVFNLLPIHPLDGFKIVGGFLPRDKANDWYQLERFGFIFLIILIIPFGQYSMLDYFIRPVVVFLTDLLTPGSFI